MHAPVKARLASVVVYIGVSAFWAGLLTVMLAVANPGRLGVFGLAELALSTMLVALVLNAGFVVVLGVLWPVSIALRPDWFRERWHAYLAGGLMSLNVTWVLWNRLAMTHQWLSARPFVTLGGLFQNVLLFVFFVSATVAVLRVLAGRPARATAATAAVLGLSIATILLVWNGRNEAYHRRYPLEVIREAAGAEEWTCPSSPTAAPRKVVLLGIDGACWSVMKPLLEAGRLPTFARLIRNGAIGYLDNHDESLSPSIWTTAYTGRPPADHGVEHYQKIVLNRSGVQLPHRLLMRPSIDTFYGVRYLFHYLKAVGPWTVDWVGSADRLEPALWEILSHYGKRVVVTNPIVNLPVQRVNGVMAMLDRRPDPDRPTVYPREIAEAWDPVLPEDTSGSTDESFDALMSAMNREVDFFIDLIRVYEADLAIYYTHAVDSVAHTNWDFHARDRFLLTRLPRGLDSDGWERLVARHADDRAFRAYDEADRAVGRIIEAFPDATFIIMSDHGWTFSGYEHFGSPEGILVVSGPGVRPGTELRGPAIEDVAPTVLALAGAPISRELPGKVIAEAFETEFRPEHVVAYRFPARPPALAKEEDVEIDASEVERLRALGYIQ